MKDLITSEAPHATYISTISRGTIYTRSYLDQFCKMNDVSMPTPKHQRTKTPTESFLLNKVDEQTSNTQYELHGRLRNRSSIVLYAASGRGLLAIANVSDHGDI